MSINQLTLSTISLDHRAWGQRGASTHAARPDRADATNSPDAMGIRPNDVAKVAVELTE